MIVLNRCYLRSAEVNIATNSFNDYFSFSSYDTQDTKVENVYPLHNKFSGRYTFTNRNHLNSDRFVRLQPEKQNGSKNTINITKNLINVSTSTLSYPALTTMTETRRVFNQNELKHTHVIKRERPYFSRSVKKNFNLLRKVPLGYSWSRYMGQTPYVVSRVSNLRSLESTTIRMTLIVQSTVVPTTHTAIKTNPERTVLTRRKMSTKRLRKKIRVKSAIPLRLRFGSRINVVTKEVTKKENNNMLPKLLKPCTKYNLIKCPYGEITIKTKHEVTNLLPSISIATVDKSTTIAIGATESTPVEAIYKYLLSYSEKVLNEISTVSKSGRVFPVTNIKPTVPAMYSLTPPRILETPLFNVSKQQGKKNKFQTAMVGPFSVLTKRFENGQA